jgi:hypothetical protein
MFTIIAAPPGFVAAKAKAAILDRGFWLTLLESNQSWLIRSPRKSPQPLLRKTSSETAR